MRLMNSGANQSKRLEDETNGFHERWIVQQSSLFVKIQQNIMGYRPPNVATKMLNRKECIHNTLVSLIFCLCKIHSYP